MEYPKRSKQETRKYSLSKDGIIPFNTIVMPKSRILMSTDDLITNLSDLLKTVSEIKLTNDKNILVFRGEQEDYQETALIPMVYRDGYLAAEHTIYRESERFNDSDFTKDISTFDKISRIQHYTAPTRLIDVSEDLFSAIYFAIAEINLKKEKDKAFLEKLESGLLNPVIYVLEIHHGKIKYYDSDTVSVVSNLAKIPLRNPDLSEKSKEEILSSINKTKDAQDFNQQPSAKFLLHEIKAEKPHFDSIIVPSHLTSVHFVLPKLANNRLKSQKGAFLLFGLNCDDVKESIKLLNNNTLVPTSHDTDHPIEKLHILRLSYDHIEHMQNELLKIGIKKSYIYPEIDKVSEFLKHKYKKA